MKELSIAEKAKAYDEALALMQDYIPDENGLVHVVPEEIFPELAESEDDRIRKALIDWFSDKHAAADFRGIAWERLVAWLNEQGKKEEEILVLKDQIESLHAAIKAVKETHRMELEKQGEQKSTDKVEPKFKVGDWVVSPNGVYWHIDSVGERYIVSSTDGISADWPLDTKLYHPFTIQDAKEGDVLSYRDGQWCFIYKGIVTEDTFKYYALLSEKGITVNDAAFSLLSSCITPATKEQRELLFQKMKEDGYEWDAEKKELKKIEQKSTWSEEDETGLTNIIIMLKEGASIHFNKNDIAKGVDWLKHLKERILPQPKQEWSKEDEEMIEGLTNCLDELEKKNGWYYVYVNDKDIKLNKVREWLKFLKDRVLPQPKQEWKPSDEQIKALETALYTNMPRNDERYSVLSKFVAELKKLREE